MAPRKYAETDLLRSSFGRHSSFREQALQDFDALSWGGLFGLLVLVLIAPAVIIVTYECTIRDIDVKSLLLYGKKNK